MRTIGLARVVVLAQSLLEYLDLSSLASRVMSLLDGAAYWVLGQDPLILGLGLLFMVILLALAVRPRR